MALRAMFFSSWMGRRLLGLGLGSALGEGSVKHRSNFRSDIARPGWVVILSYIMELVNAAADAPCEAASAEAPAADQECVSATSDMSSRSYRLGVLASAEQARRIRLRAEALQELQKMDGAEFAASLSDGWRLRPGTHDGWLTKQSRKGFFGSCTARRFFVLVVMDLAELCAKARRGNGACNGIVLFHADSESTVDESARKPTLLDESYGVQRHTSLDVPSRSFYAFSVREEKSSGHIMLGAPTPLLAAAWVWEIHEAMMSCATAGANSSQFRDSSPREMSPPKQAPAPQSSPASRPAPITMPREGDVGACSAGGVPTRREYDLSALLDLHSPAASSTSVGSAEVDDSCAWGHANAAGFSGSNHGPKVAPSRKIATAQEWSATNATNRSGAATTEASSACGEPVPVFDAPAGRAQIALRRRREALTSAFAQKQILESA
ncbi:hypothetical protein T484DRAFT_2021303 [Baffinella frigidus]|nr:hypothetical protein T484DRAFT_2021303 [Cryptophyta sp. CCMP2293]